MTFTYEFQPSGENRRVRAELDNLVKKIDEELFAGLDVAQASAVDALASQQEQVARRKNARAALRQAAKGGH